MMMAITPSLNASSLFLFIADIVVNSSKLNKSILTKNSADELTGINFGKKIKKNSF